MTYKEDFCVELKCPKCDSAEICTVWNMEGQAFRMRQNYCPIGSPIKAEEERKIRVGQQKNKLRRRTRR